MPVERHSILTRALSTPFTVLVAVLLLLATLWWIFLAEQDRDRREVEKAAHTEAANLARAFEEHVVRSLRDIDAAMLLLRKTWQARREHFEDEVSILQSAYDKGLLVQVGMIDRNGMLIYSNLQPGTPGTDLSDREHFRVHRESSDDRFFISKPVLGRVSGRASIQLTRRISDKNGAFAGVLVISLNPSYFSKFFDTLDVGNKGVIALTGLDGVIRARVSRVTGDSSGIAKVIPSDRPFLHPGAPASGVFVLPSVVDGISRITAYRRLEEYPLVVTVGFAVDDVFAKHRKQWQEYRLWAGLLSALLFVSGAALAWALHAQRRYRIALKFQAGQLARTNRELTQQHDRLQFVNDSLRLLNDIATLPQASAHEKLTEALQLGCRHLCLDLGIISRVVGDRYLVENHYAQPGTSLQDGDAFELGQTYCSITLEARDVVAISHMGASPYAGHPCYVAFQLESYIGVPLVVQGEYYGTINFSSSRPYPRNFDEGDLEFMRLLGRWAGSILTEERINCQLRMLAITDPLTGVWNRRNFLEAAEREIERAQRYGRPLSAIMLDIDHFKSVNDSFGHHAGDETLIAVAQTCREVLRTGDLFGRMGGEEFAALLLETESCSALEVCERLRSAVSDLEVLTPKGVIHITVSIGVAELYPGENSESLLSRADTALYQAKDYGRNQVVASFPAAAAG